MFWKSMRYVSGHRGKFRDLTSAFLAKQLHFYCLSTNTMRFLRYYPILLRRVLFYCRREKFT